MTKSKGGKFWNASCNPIVVTNCKCEVPNCWAMSMYHRFKDNYPKPDKDGIIWRPEQLDKIRSSGKARVWAMCWMGDVSKSSDNNRYLLDVFHYCDMVNEMRKFRKLPMHTFLFLTKFPDLCWFRQDAGKGIFIGTTVTNNKTANERIPTLIDTMGGYYCDLWLCVEPLLGPLNLRSYLLDRDNCIKQVIVGCEAGPNARPTDSAYIRSVVRQCKEANVPVFVKQVTPKSRLLDGRTYDELVWNITT
ncbi:MAG: DUF5131 family protein [candidate division Zixibacteria bacterium]|nr:DUF5131 family protein [candidate division Zixibacteria bacterium]